MASLKSRLRDLARREGTFADVKSECIRLASGDEQSYAQTRRILKNALDDGVEREQHAVLERAINRRACRRRFLRHPRRGGEDGHGAVRPAATTLTMTRRPWLARPGAQAGTTLADDEPTIISGLPAPRPSEAQDSPGR